LWFEDAAVDYDGDTLYLENSKVCTTVELRVVSVLDTIPTPCLQGVMVCSILVPPHDSLRPPLYETEMQKRLREAGEVRLPILTHGLCTHMRNAQDNDMTNDYMEPKRKRGEETAQSSGESCMVM
jgi:hypothetical protein